MSKHEAVVYLEPGLRTLREEASWLLRYVRRPFDVWLTRERGDLRVALGEGTLITVIVCEGCPDVLTSTLEEAPVPARLIVVAAADRLDVVRASDAGKQGIRLIECDKVRERFPRHFAPGLVETVFVRFRRALPKLERLARRPRLLRALKRLMAENSIAPLGSVNAMAAFVKRSQRWIEIQWASMWAEDEPHPQLSEVAGAVLFLRALSLWLDGLSLHRCADRLGVSQWVLRRRFVGLTGKLPSELTPEELPELILKLEREVFYWLRV